MSTRPPRVALGCAWGAALIAVTCLAGWVVGSRALTAIGPGYTSMKVNTALCGLLLAVAAGSRRHWLQRLGALAVLTLVTGTLIEYLVDANLGIDQLLVQDSYPGINPPGRMAPVTAISFGLLSLARLGWVKRSTRLAHASTSSRSSRASWH